VAHDPASADGDASPATLTYAWRFITTPEGSTAYLDDATISRFQLELAAMGYKFQFITLAGWHALNSSAFDLARGYTESGMTAYVKLQQAEFGMEEGCRDLDEAQSEAIHFIPELAHTYLRCPACASPDFEVVRGRGVWLAQVATKVNIPPLGESDFGNAENREIFRTLNSFIMRDEAWDFEIFQDEIDEQLHGRLAWLTAYAAQLPPPGLMAQQEDAAKTMFRLRLQQLKAKGNQLKFLQDDAHRNGDREAMRSYDIINNQNLRDLFHLQMLLKRLREMVFDRERQD
jgi:Zn finger protein HypA/HybF involved in hydrogenase expression